MNAACDYSILRSKGIRFKLFVTPAKAGVQWLSGSGEPAPDLIRGRWIPACAGMTIRWAGMALINLESL